MKDKNTNSELGIETKYQVPIFTFGIGTRITAISAIVGGKRKLAELAGISESQLHRIVSGKSNAKIETITAMAKISDVNLDWLATGEGLSRKSDVLESNANKPMDYNLVQIVVEAVEEILIETDRELTPSKKGQLICAVLDLYSDLYSESDTKPEKEKVLRLVQLAA